MWLKLIPLAILLHQLSPVSCEQYQKLRPINDMCFVLHHVKITYQFRLREDLRYSVHNEMVAQAVDGSVQQIPVRSPNFFGRHAFIQRLAVDTKKDSVGDKQFLKQLYFSNMYVLDYEDQFFPQDKPIIIDLKGTKILDQRGLFGLQERYYWDKFTQKEEFYLFTNLFPNHVSDAIPFVTDWRTNIELKVQIPNAIGHYSVITPGTVDHGGQYIFNRTCLSDISFVVLNSVKTKRHQHLLFSAKTEHGESFPDSMLEFYLAAVRLFPGYEKFLSFSFPSVAQQMHLMTLPALNVRPLVLASQMCLFDQDWIATQWNNFPHLLAKCFIHQYFCATLLPYSPPLRFIPDALSAYYAILSLKDVDSEDRLASVFNQVLVDEERGHTERILFRGYLEDYPSDQRTTNKGVYLIHMIRSHFKQEQAFDGIIQDFMKAFRNISFSYNDFTFAFYNNHYKQLNLSNYEDFRLFLNSWTGSTGYPLISIQHEMGKLILTTKLTKNSKGQNITLPVHLLLMDVSGGTREQVIWLNSTESLAISYNEKAFPFYFVNAPRNTPARVLYPGDHWERIWKQNDLIPNRIRAVLLNDAFYFLTHGQLRYDVAFPLLKWLKGEKRAHLWIAMEPVIMEMNRQWIFTDLHEPFREVIREVIKEFYLSQRDHNSSLAIKFACWSQLPECLQDAEKKVLQFIDQPQIRSEMHLDTTLCGGMRRISSKVYHHLIRLAKRVSGKRDVLLMAMCCNEAEHDIELFVRSMFNRNEFDLSMDMKYLLLINIFMSSSTGAEVVWRFTDQWHELLFSQFGRGRFQEYLSFLADYLKRKSQYRSLQLIFQKFDLHEGNVFQIIIENHLRAEKESTEKYEYLTEDLLRGLQEGG